jgi:diacylglycerol kinase family enzyme
MSAPIGVVTNPRSGGQHDPRALAYVLGEEGELVAPGDLDALAAHVRRFRDRGIGTLCIDGGDGTIHRVLTAMVHVYADVDLPPIAILRSGTMNNVAASIGQRLSASDMLRVLVEARAAGRALPTTERHLLSIDANNGARAYGFFVGAGLVARFLELYDARGSASPVLAGSLLVRAVAAALLGGPLSRDLDRPFEGTVALDAAPLTGERFTAVAVSTIEQIGFGFRVFHELASAPDRLQLVTIAGSLGSLALELPGLYAGHGVRAAGNTSATGLSVTLVSSAPFPYVIDGDPYEARNRTLRITIGPTVTFLTAT